MDVGLQKIFIGLIAINSLIPFSYSQSQIPLEMYKKQSNIRTAQEFVQQMLQRGSTRPQDSSRQYEPSGPSSRPSGSTGLGGPGYPGMHSLSRQGTNAPEIAESIIDSETVINEIATPDVCEPRQLSVPIPPDRDPRVMLWPTCTKLNRCGGCCGHELLECTPTSTRTVKVQVMRERLTDEGNHFQHAGTLEVELESHLACECQCKVKARDCNADIHDYDAVNCKCTCRNADRATSCQRPKLWDDKLCRCVCSNFINCLEDEYFNFNTCSCVRGSPQLLAGESPMPMQSLSGGRCARTKCGAGMRARWNGSRCLCHRV